MIRIIMLMLILSTLFMVGCNDEKTVIDFESMKIKSDPIPVFGHYNSSNLGGVKLVPFNGSICEREEKWERNSNMN